MDALFLQVVDMTASASILVGVVILLRLALRKAPKAIHCALWAMVALRLVCPSLPESPVSLMPDSHPVTSVVQQETEKPPGTDQQPQVQVPQASAPNNVATTPAEPEKTVDWAGILTGIWLAGVGVMALYGIGSYLYLRRKVAPAVKEDGVWLCDHVASPFILGLFRPRIYLPSGLEEDYRASVLAHEQAHIRRGDHWWKPLGFGLLAVHWFNPVMWLAYVLLCRDIEAACDEKVVKGMDAADRRMYSEALLRCAAPRRSIAACPLAFGEQGIKGRIKSVLSYKKPTLWIILVALVASVAVGVFFLTDPLGDEPEKPAETPCNLENLNIKAPSYFELDTFKGIEVYVWEEDGQLVCGAMSGTNRRKEDAEIQSLKGIKLEEMALILDTYVIPDWNISVHPYGPSQYWTQEQIQSNRWVEVSDQLRPQLDLYVMGENETVGNYTVATEGQVFGNGYFMAEGYDGMYMVFCSDMEGISKGDRLSISFVNKRVVTGSNQFEITAKKICNYNASKPSVHVAAELRIVQSRPSGQAFEKDCFYATDDGKDVYRVYWTDMSGLKEGQSIRVVYNYTTRVKLDQPAPPGEWSPQYEITASKVEVVQDHQEYVTTVYFRLYDELLHEGMSANQEPTASYYAAPITQEELDVLQGLQGDRQWMNPMLFSSLGWYDGSMNVVAGGKWSVWTLYRGGILTEKGFSPFTDEERAVYQALMARAALSEDAKNYFSDDYLVNKMNGAL